MIYLHSIDLENAQNAKTWSVNLLTARGLSHPSSTRLSFIALTSPGGPHNKALLSDPGLGNLSATNSFVIRPVLYSHPSGACETT